MKLTKEQTIKAAKYCTTISNCATCCMVNEHDCRAEIIKHVLHYLEENEPASAPTETSPKETTLRFDDNTLLGICQAFNFADRAVNTILDTYNTMSESEQRGFDLGESYRDILNARCELEKLKAGEPE